MNDGVTPATDESPRLIDSSRSEGVASDVDSGLPSRPVRRLSRWALTGMIAAVVVTPPSLVLTLWTLFPVQRIPKLPVAVTIAKRDDSVAGPHGRALVVENRSDVAWDRMKVELRGRVGVTSQYEFNPSGPLRPGETVTIPLAAFVTHWGRPFADDLASMHHVTVSAQLPQRGRALTEVPIREIRAASPQRRLDETESTP